MVAQVWLAMAGVNHPNCLFCCATARRRVCAEIQMRHFQLLGLKQLVGPLQADRNCARTEETARNKQPMSNPLQNHSRWGAAAAEGRLRTLTFKAGTVRCFALQPVFKHYPDSFLIKHENPSREHADPAVPDFRFPALHTKWAKSSLGMDFSSSNQFKAKAKLKLHLLNMWW